MPKRTTNTQPTPQRTSSTVMPYLEPEQLTVLLIHVEAAHVAAHNLHNAILSGVIEPATLTVLGITTSYRIEVVQAKLEAQGLTEEPIIDLLKLLRRYIDGVTRTINGVQRAPATSRQDPMLPHPEQLSEYARDVMTKLAGIAEQVRLELEEWA